jgi:hypothetical protein
LQRFVCQRAKADYGYWAGAGRGSEKGTRGVLDLNQVVLNTLKQSVGKIVLKFS